MDSQPNIAGAENALKRAGNKLNPKVVMILLIFVGVGLLLFLGFVIKIPIPSNPLDLLKMKPSVALKKEYKNPFSKETQYVNPFQTYKNPFVVSK